MSEIPSLPGVYYFYEGKKLLYVGKSINLKRRIRYHQLNTYNSQLIDTIFNRIDKIEFKILNENNIHQYEINEIRRLKPIFNHETYGDDIVFDIIKTQKDDLLTKVKDTI